ncbi:unnamed protein product [Knipowitschia caucasica]|uniref:C2H2-type domain-containing protein n=1 Tax=Knipowitschia caucasica TaxID=637954 RepID=A0AAV2K2J6_KNICA
MYCQWIILFVSVSTLVSPDPAVALPFRTQSPDLAAVQLFTDVSDQQLLQETLQICEARKELFQTLTKEEPVTFSLNALFKEEPREFSVGNKDQPEGLVKTEPELQCILPVIKPEPEPEDLQRPDPSPSPHQDLDHEPDQDFPQDSELSGQWQFEGLPSRSSDREHTDNSSEEEAPQSQSLWPKLVVNLSPKATLPLAQGLDGSQADADVTENSSDSNSPSASAATAGPSSVSVKLRPLCSDLVRSALSGQVAKKKLSEDHDTALQAKQRVKLHKKRARAGGRASEEGGGKAWGGEEANHHCSICDRKFALQCLVKRHMKSHDCGEVCGRSFSTNLLLEHYTRTRNRNETHNKKEPNRRRRRETKQPVKKKKPNDMISYNKETIQDKLQNTDKKCLKVKTKESKGKRRSAELGATTSIRTPEQVNAAKQRVSATCRRGAELSRKEQRKLSKEAANVSSAACFQVGSAPSNMCKLSAAASKRLQPHGGTQAGVSNLMSQCKQTTANQRQSWGNTKAAAAKRRKSVGEEEAKRQREDTDTDKTEDSSDDSPA